DRWGRTSVRLWHRPAGGRPRAAGPGRGAARAVRGRGGDVVPGGVLRDHGFVPDRGLAWGQPDVRGLLRPCDEAGRRRVGARGKGAGVPGLSVVADLPVHGVAVHGAAVRPDRGLWGAGVVVHAVPGPDADLAF